MASKMKYTRNESKSLIPSSRVCEDVQSCSRWFSVWDTSYEVTYTSTGDQHESKASMSEHYLSSRDLHCLNTYSLAFAPSAFDGGATSIGFHHGYAETVVFSIVPVNCAGRFCMKLSTPSLLSLQCFSTVLPNTPKSRLTPTQTSQTKPSNPTNAGPLRSPSPSTSSPSSNTYSPHSYSSPHLPRPPTPCPAPAPRHPPRA